MNGAALALEPATATTPYALPATMTPDAAFTLARSAPTDNASAPDLARTLSTGVERLDLLLRGGLPAGTTTLLYGSPFTGKDVLQRETVLAAVRRGTPTTFLLHTVSAAEMSRRLRRVDPLVAVAEEEGLLRYIDLYECVVPRDEAGRRQSDLDRILGSIEPTRAAPAHGIPAFLAIQSMSAILADIGPTWGFGVLRGIQARAAAQGWVANLCMESGMNPMAEVQTAKHLCNGMVEFRRQRESFALRIEGHETVNPQLGWVEYAFGADGFHLTGTFNPGRIPARN